MKKFIALVTAIILMTSSFNVFAEDLLENVTIDEASENTDSGQNPGDEEREEEEETKDNEEVPTEELLTREIPDVNEAGELTLQNEAYSIIREPFELDEENSSYYINNEDGFQVFQEAVKNGSSFEGYTVVLKSSLDLKGKPMEPIGTASTPFLGNFDGEGNTISNIILIKSSDVSGYYGFFGYAGGSNKINIKAVNLDFEEGINDTSALYTGLLGANIFNAIIENCRVSGDIQVAGSSNTGGLLGYAQSVVIRESHVDIDSINYTVQAGGIVGRARGALTVTDSTFKGNINFTGSNHDEQAGVGGIIGSFGTPYDGNNWSLSIKGCTVRSNITVDSTNSVYNIGGIAGYHYNTYFDIENTKFEGTIKVSSSKKAENIGGIIGYSSASYRTMDTLETAGEINAEGTSAANIGMIAGYIEMQRHMIPVRAAYTYDIKLNKSDADGSILVTGTNKAENVGGIIGAVVNSTGSYSAIEITESSLSGDKIKAEGNEIFNIGGIVGSIDGSKYEIKNTNLFLNEIAADGGTVSNISGGIAYNNLLSVDNSNIQENSLIEECEIKTDIQIDAAGNVSDIGGMTVINGRNLMIKNSTYKGGIEVIAEENISDIGGIVVTYSEIIIDGVKFDGNITARGKELKSSGGIIAGTYSCLLMKDTSFTGNIEFDFTMEIDYIGGVMGEINSTAVHIKNTDIYGDIIVNAPYIRHVGGFAGRIKIDTYQTPEAEMFEKYTEFFGESSVFENIGVYGSLKVNLTHTSYLYASYLSGFASFIEGANPVRIMSAQKVAIKNITRWGDIIITNNSMDGMITVEKVGGMFNFADLTNYGIDYEIENASSNSNVIFEEIISGIITLDSIGSFAGVMSGSASIMNSYASGNIDIGFKASAEAGAFNIGGFAGYLDSYSRDIRIHNSYSTADIILEDKGSEDYGAGNIGGFLGFIPNSSLLEAESCYYGGSLNITEGEYVDNIYVFAGAASSAGADVNIKSCYYDSSKNSLYPVAGGNTSTIGIHARNPYEMTRENADGSQEHKSEVESMDDFDFANIWVWTENNKEKGYYPQLKVFAFSSDSEVRNLSQLSAETHGYYYIVLDGNGGKTIDGIAVDSDWMLYDTVVCEPVYILDDIPMKRWNTNAEGTGEDYPLNFKVDDDAYLYAMYTEAPIPTSKYTVTYDINGGAGTVPIDSSRYSSGAKVTVLGSTGFSRKGYSFEGWQLNGSAELYQGGNTFIISRNSVLTAKWKNNGSTTEDKDRDKEEPVVKGNYKTPEIPAELPELNREEHFAYIVGYPDNTVRPENNITREELASIYFRLLTDDSREKFYSAENPFNDVDVSRWSNKAISTLYNAGILSGDSEERFRPSENITRAEAAVIAARFDAGKYSGDMYFTDIAGHWAHEYINKAAYLGWIKGYDDGTFKPDSYITRAEAVTFINQVLDRNVLDSSQMNKYMTTWLDNMDESKWYYSHIQEAGNGHTYYKNGIYETWTELLPPKQWIELERP